MMFARPSVHPLVVCVLGGGVPVVVLDEGADGHKVVHDAGNGGSPCLRVQDHLRPP